MFHFVWIFIIFSLNFGTKNYEVEIWHWLNSAGNVIIICVPGVGDDGGEEGGCWHVGDQRGLQCRRPRQCPGPWHRHEQGQRPRRSGQHRTSHWVSHSPHNPTEWILRTKIPLGKSSELTSYWTSPQNLHFIVGELCHGYVILYAVMIFLDIKFCAKTHFILNKYVKKYDYDSKLESSNL